MTLSVGNQLRGAMHEALLEAAGKAAKRIRGRAVANVTGRVLKSRTGRLRQSIFAEVRESSAGVQIVVGQKGDTARHGLYLERGTKAYMRKLKGKFRGEIIGARGGRATLRLRQLQKRVPPRAAKPWLWPAVKESLASIRGDVAREVRERVQKAGDNLNVKIKI